LKNLLIINESKSSNIGDRAITNGLSELFQIENINISTLDLSLRSEFEEGEIKLIQRRKWGAGIKNLLRPIWNEIQIKKKFSDYKKNDIRAQFLKADFIIFGGGSILIDNQMRFPTFLECYSNLAKTLNKPYAFVGCSARSAASRKARGKLIRSLEGAQFVDVRDINSQRVLKTWGIDSHLSVDTAFFCDTKVCVPREERAFVNVIAPQSHGRLADQKRYRAYIESIDTILEWIRNKYGNVTVLTTGDVFDNGFVRERFGGRYQICTPRSLDELNSEIQAASIVIASRLHCTILTLLQKKNVVALSWDEKIDGFMETMGADGIVVNAFCAEAPLFVERIIYETRDWEDLFLRIEKRVNIERQCLVERVLSC
jgi:polysaccharide pyruvyl transferase WcaK-like protein